MSELNDKGTAVILPRIAPMVVNQPLVSARPPPPEAVGTVPVGLLLETNSAPPDSAAPLPAIVGQRKIIVEIQAVSINTVFATRTRHLLELLR